MQKIRYGLIVLCLLTCSATYAPAQVSIGIGLPNVSIGINLPLFPELVPVPGYPVYYAPRVDSNYFFYDGMYWVFHDDNWYASTWYNGPWVYVDPYSVPLFILRIPVRYYRQPPVYFHGWHANAPPRWGHHWGHRWEQRRGGWDRWQRSSVPSRAPLPVYQRSYSGDRYPRVEQQHRLRSQSYRYEPRDKAVRQHFQRQSQHGVSAPDQRGRQEEHRMRTPGQQGGPSGPGLQPRQRGGEELRRPAPLQAPPQQRGPSSIEQRRQPGVERRELQAPPQGQGERRQDRGESQERGRGHGQGQERDDGRGRGRD